VFGQLAILLLLSSRGSELTCLPTGKIPAIGADWGLTDAKGNFSPDAMYVLQTADGANIFVRGQGRIPNEAVVFETGSDKYAWLNSVVAIAQAKRVGDGLSLDVFQVGTVNLPSIADSCVCYPFLSIPLERGGLAITQLDNRG